MNVIERLDKEKLEILYLYQQLETSKFGKTKKSKYEEIVKRTKKNINTVKSWIDRYYKPYKKYLEEIEAEENAKICNMEGLTQKQTTYIIARMNGFETQEAKEMAGYSANTKAADIEKNPKVLNKMELLREKLFDDTKLGAEVIANRLVEIMKLGEEGIEVTETEYHDETNPEGRVVYKKARKKTIHNLAASTSAARLIADMLGYNYIAEQKLKVIPKETEEETATITDKDFE